MDGKQVQIDLGVQMIARAMYPAGVVDARSCPTSPTSALDAGRPPAGVRVPAGERRDALLGQLRRLPGHRSVLARRAEPTPRPTRTLISDDARSTTSPLEWIERRLGSSSATRGQFTGSRPLRELLPRPVHEHHERIRLGAARHRDRRRHRAALGPEPRLDDPADDRLRPVPQRRGLVGPEDGRRGRFGARAGPRHPLQREPSPGCRARTADAGPTVTWARERGPARRPGAFDMVVSTVDMWTLSKLLVDDARWSFTEKYIGTQTEYGTTVWDLQPGYCYLDQDRSVLAPGLQQGNQETLQFTASYSGTPDGGYDLATTFTTYIESNLRRGRPPEPRATSGTSRCTATTRPRSTASRCRATPTRACSGSTACGCRRSWSDPGGVSRSAGHQRRRPAARRTAPDGHLLRREHPDHGTPRRARSCRPWRWPSTPSVSMPPSSSPATTRRRRRWPRPSSTCCTS